MKSWKMIVILLEESRPFIQLISFFVSLEIANMQQQLMSQSGVQNLTGQTPGQGSHHQMQHYIPQGKPPVFLSSCFLCLPYKPS